MSWPMLRFYTYLLAGVVGAVALPGTGRAAETTGRGVSATVYGGGGSVEVPNNESAADGYDERRVGTGVLGVVRFGGHGSSAATPVRPKGDHAPAPPPPKRDAVSERGAFVALAATFELEALRQTACGWVCRGGSGADQGAETSYRAEQHFAGRVGIGYSFGLVELRGGVLATMPDPSSRVQQSLVLPDAQLRLGRRSVGWFELGLGAYDASTNLRPGVYLGGAYGSDEQVRVSGHLGLHFVNGVCCSTVPKFGFRYELGFDHAVSDMLRLGLGGAVSDADTIEAAARLSLLL